MTHEQISILVLGVASIALTVIATIAARGLIRLRARLDYANRVIGDFRRANQELTRKVKRLERQRTEDDDGEWWKHADD